MNNNHYLSTLITETYFPKGYKPKKRNKSSYRLQVKNKPNYELKSQALKSGMVGVAKSLQLNFYRLVNDKVDYETYLNIKENLVGEIYDVELYEESLKILKADYQRKKRLIERITNLLNSGNCIFLTLTFTDKVLNSTQEHVRRKYVQQFLKCSSSSYVANIDFGKTNGREHYHAVVLADRVNPNYWKYGNLDFERVRHTSSEIKLAQYICKLVNHAIKETTKRNHLIYSRKVD